MVFFCFSELVLQSKIVTNSKNLDCIGIQNVAHYWFSCANEEQISDDIEAKLMLLIRSDLKMEKGKICAQASHAVLKSVRRNTKFANKRWIKNKLIECYKIGSE